MSIENGRQEEGSFLRAGGPTRAELQSALRRTAVLGMGLIRHLILALSMGLSSEL